MKKRIFMLIGIIFILLLSSCYRESHYIPIEEGHYETIDTFECDVDYYKKIMLDVKEITYEDFVKAEHNNVLEDFSQKEEKKYYSFQIQFVDKEDNIVDIPMKFVKEGFLPADGPNRYFVTLLIPFEQETLECKGRIAIEGHNINNKFEYEIQSYYYGPESLTCEYVTSGLLESID